jgi:3',5'-cyclic AMP phosphodiesterase CpdA
MAVPGNHDVPLYNIFSRLFRGLARYKRYITDDLEPFYADDTIAVLGINTARSLAIAGGRVSPQQIASIKARMCGLGRSVVKVLVTHHPFDLPEGSVHQDIVGRAREAMTAIAGCGVDVILSGHLHLIHTGHSAERFEVGGHSTLIVQAGTATSTRGRGEQNSFNVLRLTHQHIEVERRVWHEASGAFAASSREIFARTPAGWVRPPPSQGVPADLRDL